jgi:hypothetical protein
MPTCSVATRPLAVSPLMPASCVLTPSPNTRSLAKLTAARLALLPLWPLPAYTAWLVPTGSASCEVLILLAYWLAARVLLEPSPGQGPAVSSGMRLQPAAVVPVVVPAVPVVQVMQVMQVMPVMLVMPVVLVVLVVPVVPELPVVPVVPAPLALEASAASPPPPPQAVRAVSDRPLAPPASSQRNARQRPGRLPQPLLQVVLQPGVVGVAVF